ncbi:MAG: thiosulfate oxidation carrier complex protein SoxZ [Gammaproteobacteria bacterium]|nr:thiosulfate oxidation carrier complex protein SoxZ [Gammaproteobacteria bacterium]
MARTTKIKARSKGGATEILVLVSHPMETGQRVDKKTKKKVPAHFIQKMTFKLNGKEFADANLGPAVSKNPVVGVRVSNAKKGDKVSVRWSDNMGESGDATTTV